MNLLEIGRILRPHGIKGAVKVESYLEDGLKGFKNVYITSKHIKTKITSVQSLNNDFYIVYFDCILDTETAEKFRNQSVFIDRDEYDEYKDKLYLSDLINRPVKNEQDEVVGHLVDFDDYGANVVLSIKCGVVVYQLPYVEELIKFDKTKDCFIVNQKTFEDMRI